MTIEEWKENFSETLTDELLKRGMKQYELAKAANISPGMLSSYINKESTPSIKAIINIASALDMDYFDLIDYGDTID